TKCRFTYAVIDVFVLEFGSEFGGKIVHLDDDSADAGNEKVVTEHRWDRDTERGDRCDKRTRNTWRHRNQVRGTSLGNAGKGIHPAPDGAKQAENGEPLTAVASKIICDSSESAVSPTARSIAAFTAPICAGEILSAISRRARKVSSTSDEPSKWKVISSQPARYTLKTAAPGKRAFFSNRRRGCRSL